MVVRAAHDHQLGDLREDARLLADRGRDIRQRADRHQDDVAVRVHIGVDQPVDRVLRLHLGGGRRQIQEVAVDAGGRDLLLGVAAH